MRALSLGTIAKYGREFALAYSDGSSTGGTGNGGYGKFLRRAMQSTEDQAPAFTSEARAATNSPKSKAKSPNFTGPLFFNIDILCRYNTMDMRKIFTKLPCIFLTLFPLVAGDVYLHNPRGSNNRLDERSRNRANANSSIYFVSCLVTLCSYEVLEFYKVIPSEAPEFAICLVLCFVSQAFSTTIISLILVWEIQCIHLIPILISMYRG
ncbi:protein dd3-3-like [Plakobranchus ocellatus]|uniref:Protein dd3-3-like n=1 Tax=Plakobranchus ocellatus TaxID=259542 RepID=A0AAV4DJM2_9GAST|nr:protein dd3-3-like [Plakobranchus ocellatus]